MRRHDTGILPRAVAFGPFLVWLSAATACGGAAPAAGESGAATSASKGASVVAQEKIDRCAGVSATDVAPIVGVAPSLIETTNVQQHSTLRICGYRAQSGEGGASFSLAWEPSVEEAKEQFGRERDDLGLANRVIASASKSGPAESPYVDVLGLGDDAFWTPVNGTTVTRVGNVRVQVMMPSDRKIQTAIAQLVVKGLR